MEKVNLNLDSFDGITFKTKAIGDQKNQMCFRIRSRTSIGYFNRAFIKISCTSYEMGEKSN